MTNLTQNVLVAVDLLQGSTVDDVERLIGELTGHTREDILARLDALADAGYVVVNNDGVYGITEAGLSTLTPEEPK